MDRPLRLEGIDPERAYKPAEIKKLKEEKERSPSAPAVIKRIHSQDAEAAPLYGRSETTIKGKATAVEYEPDPDLRDTEQFALLHEGGLTLSCRRKPCPTRPTRGTRRTK